MSFKSAFVLGFGFYVGYKLAKGIDEALYDVFRMDDLMEKYGIKTSESKQPNDETIIGFRA